MAGSNVSPTRLAKHRAADHQAAGAKALAAFARFAEYIAVVEFTLGKLDDAGVTGRADTEMTDFLLADGRGRRNGRGADHVSERHPQRQQFRHRRDLVESRSVDAQRMHIAADDVGEKSGRQHRLGGAEAKRTAAVANIEDNASLARRGDFLAYAAVRRRRRVGKRAEAMGKDVAATQPRHDLKP